MSEDLALKYKMDARRMRIAAAIPPYHSVSRQRSVRNSLYAPNRYPEPRTVWIRSGSSGALSLRRR
jgi:hypothetical protein